MTSKSIAINGRFLLKDITGVQRVERELLKQFDHLAMSGIITTPIVYVPKCGCLVSPPKLRRIRIVRVGLLKGQLWEQVELPFYCNQDILINMGNSCPLLSLFLNHEVFCMIHDLSYRYFPDSYKVSYRFFYGLLTPFILRFAQYILTVSKAEHTKIISDFKFLRSAKNFGYFQNGGVTNDFVDEPLTSLPAQSARRFGIYVGSLNQRKNAHGIIVAASEFLKKNKKHEFYIVGGSSTIFTKLGIELDDELKSRLHFLGQENNPEVIYELFSQSLFLLFPSFYESSPLPPIEAMQFGCPVIASNILSMMERCGDAALYCDPYSIPDINATILKLTSSSDLWSSLTQKGQDHAQTYSWSKQCRFIVDFCRLRQVKGD